MTADALGGDSAARNHHLPLRGQGDLHLVVVVDPDQAPGLLANTVATICVGLGAMHPGLGCTELRDATGTAIRASADRPVPVLQADDNVMHALLARATSLSNVTVIAFPTFARSLHSFMDYEAEFQVRALSDQRIEGVGLCGPSKVVRSLTGSLKLLR